MTKSESLTNNRSTTFQTKVKNIWKYIKEEYIKFPTYILAHPLKGFDIFKREKKAKMSVAITFVFILIILQILEFQYTGFVVSQQDVNDLNTIKEIGYVILPIVLVTIGNWSVTTLFDGKGKMGEIFMMICYSLYPLIWAKAVGLVFSNIITTAEVGFYGLIMGLGTFLLGYMIFFGLVSIHEYGVGKCIISIAFTGLAVMVLLFIILLGFDLFQKIYMFVYTIYREISLRYL